MTTATLRDARCPCCGEIGSDTKNSGWYRCATSGCRVIVYTEEG